MRFVADLHIHSHYSLSTSRELTPPRLESWARRKGILVVGTGDATHPGWLKELQSCLETMRSYADSYWATKGIEHSNG